MLKHELDRSLVNSLSIIVCFALLFSSLASAPHARPKSSSMVNQRVPANIASKDSQQAYALLNKAKDFLRRHRSDQALVLLNTALPLFKRAGDLNGQAATHDGLGDLYSFYGQYQTAIREYQSAQVMFRSANQRINTDLVLAKLGDLYYLMG